MWLDMEVLLFEDALTLSVTLQRLCDIQDVTYNKKCYSSWEHSKKPIDYVLLQKTCRRVKDTGNICLLILPYARTLCCKKTHTLTGRQTFVVP